MLVIHHLLCVIFILSSGSTKPCCVNPSKRHRQKRYSEDDICFRTNGTIVNVDTCPKNLYDLLRRSQRKKCDSFQPCRNESLVYHCVRFEDSIIEVCAPKGTITGRCCPKYEAGLGRVIEDFSRPCPGCPFVYKSDSFAEYVECSATYRKNISDQGMADGKDNFECSNITCNIHSSTNFSRENHNSTAGKEIGNYPEDIKIVLYKTGAVVIVTIILMLFFVSKRTRECTVKMNNSSTEFTTKQMDLKQDEAMAVCLIEQDENAVNLEPKDVEALFRLNNLSKM